MHRDMLARHAAGGSAVVPAGGGLERSILCAWPGENEIRPVWPGASHGGLWGLCLSDRSTSSVATTAPARVHIPSCTVDQGEEQHKELPKP